MDEPTAKVSAWVTSPIISKSIDTWSHNIGAPLFLRLNDRCLTKALVTDLKEILGGLKFRSLGQDDAGPVKSLDSVYQRRPVLLAKNVCTNLDREIRTYANEVAIESGMVERAQRKAVSDKRVSSRLRVGNDVGGIQQFLVPKATEGALTPVRIEHSLAECPLMQADADSGSHVSSARRIYIVARGRAVYSEPAMHSVVNRD